MMAVLRGESLHGRVYGWLRDFLSETCRIPASTVAGSERLSCRDLRDAGIFSRFLVEVQ